MLRSRRIQAVVVIALLAAPLLMLGDRALAIQDSEDKVWFGPIGLGIGQATRINVYSIGNPEVIGNPDERPWTFTARIFNRRGEVVLDRSLPVPRGAIGSFEIPPIVLDNLSVDRLGRRTLRAEIVGFNPQPDPPGKWSATLEVYSALTGHTSLLLGLPDSLPKAGAVIGPSGAGH